MTETMTVGSLLAAALQGIYRASSPGGGRPKPDVFADRLVRAAAEPTLARAVEVLLRAANVQLGELPGFAVTAVTRLLESDEQARAALALWREQPRLLALVAAEGTPDAAAVLASAEVVSPPRATAGARRPFDITLCVTCETPLVHGADDRAGNAVLFRRTAVRVADGVLHLPYYSGNAVRGQLRDLLADDFLARLGLPVSRQMPALHLWFFYALYSGGALAESSELPVAARKFFGDHGAHRPEAYRQFRALLPGLSVLGCAIGNRILSGHCAIGDLRPRCREWGTGDLPAADLFVWEYLTRREDLESHVDHTGMIAYTEALRAGTILDGGIDYGDAITDLERAALGHGLALLQARGYLGAENRRGLGRVRIEVTGAPDGAPYVAHLAAQRETILAFLRDLGALLREPQSLEAAP